MRKLIQSLSFRIFILMMVIVTCSLGLYARLRSDRMQLILLCSSSRVSRA